MASRDEIRAARRDPTSSQVSAAGAAAAPRSARRSVIVDTEVEAPQRAGLPAKRRVDGRIAALRLFGPAFVAAIAYIGPGNYATNIQAGAQYGYLLLWVQAV